MNTRMLDREEFPNLREDIGEDPARYLDHDYFLMCETIRARIRGIDSFAVLRAWEAVERRIDRGPRDKVLEWLEEREAELGEIGEREDRPDGPIERDVPEKTAVWVDDDGDEYVRVPGEHGWRREYLDDGETEAEVPA